MEERRKLGLCYNCDEKWQMGHKCTSAKLFLLEYFFFILKVLYRLCMIFIY